MAVFPPAALELSLSNHDLKITSVCVSVFSSPLLCLPGSTLTPSCPSAETWSWSTLTSGIRLRDTAEGRGWTGCPAQRTALTAASTEPAHCRPSALRRRPRKFVSIETEIDTSKGLCMPSPQTASDLLRPCWLIWPELYRITWICPREWGRSTPSMGSRRFPAWTN